MGKKENENFDVTMGAYDGAEVCELVGIYLQFLINQKYNKQDFGLYRDDGLAVFKGRGSVLEKIKKELQNIFKENHLEIIIECNMKVVNYLDITLNLNDGTYKPFHKPNDKILYINSQSNHPPAILKQLPLSIEKRLSYISSSKEIFENSVKPYQDALRESGYKHKLEYQPTKLTAGKRKNRKRDIIWFNPPFSKSVSTNVGKYFLSLIDKHFPRHHKFRKIFNRNTLKISYACLPNMKAKMNQHNKKVLRENDNDQIIENKKECSCPGNTICPMEGKCLEKDILYEAKITCNLPNYGEKYYKGICSTTWKDRFNNHTKSFTNTKYKNETELAKEVWKVKNCGGSPSIKWKKERKYASYKPEKQRCSLCEAEKVSIAMSEIPILNRKNEIISRCRHRFKFKLKNCS